MNDKYKNNCYDWKDLDIRMAKAMIKFTQNIKYALLLQETNF